MRVLQCRAMRSLNCKSKLPIVQGRGYASAAPPDEAALQMAKSMIQLTRLNNQPLVVNSDLIKFLERAPDTVLTLVTGEKIIVRETSEEVLSKIIAFRQAILAGVAVRMPGDPASSAAAISSASQDRKD
jgi:flagellar protein FlbD